MVSSKKYILTILCFSLGWGLVKAQENVGPLLYKPFPQNEKYNRRFAKEQSFKTTALTLPFFEDFTDNSFLVNPLRWVPTTQVYVNNTMGFDMKSRGVVTLDAIGPRGLPHDTLSATSLRFGDSLTSQPIDLSLYAPGDSIYLSF